jgi:hypothetical protein
MTFLYTNLHVLIAYLVGKSTRLELKVHLLNSQKDTVRKAYAFHSIGAVSWFVVSRQRSNFPFAEVELKKLAAKISQ